MYCTYTEPTTPEDKNDPPTQTTSESNDDQQKGISTHYIQCSFILHVCVCVCM